MERLLPRWLRHSRYLWLGLLSVSLIVLPIAWSPSAQWQTETARPAADFVNSVGVATHLRYLDTAYKHYDDIIKPRLLELGVRHIRDGGKNKGFYEKLNDLAGYGIRATLVMDPRDGLTPDNAIAEGLQPVLGAVEAVEGPNEWDVHPKLRYQGLAFPDGVRNYQTGLYRALKANPDTQNLPVLLPSLAIPENGRKLGKLEAGDMGNMHSYAGGNLPSQDLDTRWIPQTQAVTGPDKPLVATECGWHTAVSDRRASQPGVPEEVVGRYAPRLALEYFNRGIVRSFLYQLIDERKAEKQEQRFGLLRHDGTPKPAFTSLKNLLALLEDGGSVVAPQTMQYYLSGDTKQVHHTLLQKSDGRFYLVLWQEVPGFGLRNRKVLSPATKTVTLNLAQPFVTANTYRPLESATAIASFTNGAQLSLSVPDHPLVVELVPRTA